MTSKITRYCQQLLEAGWLAAIVTIPLYFNIYSDRVFEADKTVLLRTIALLMVAAWVVLTVERLATGQTKWPTPAGIIDQFREQPFLFFTALLVFVYLLTTIFSVTPHISWFGSYRRLQGSSTLLAYCLICVLTLLHLRSREQLERAITTIILTSVPITLYAAVQRLNADPIPWGEGWQVRVQLRVVGQLGHPIFVAAYLMMNFPLTIGRIMGLLEVNEGRNWKRLTLVGLYSLIGVLQIVAIYWSGSRGPLLGLLIGLFVFGLVWLQNRGHSPAGRRLWFAGIGLAAFMLIGLLLFNLPVEPTAAYRQTPVIGGLLNGVERLKELPTIGRFGQLLESGSGSGRVRVLIWEGMVDLIGSHRPLTYADGRPDNYNGLRWLIGYGPDALSLVYSPFFRPEIATIETRDSNVDRAHNETLDVLAMTGIVGLIAWQLIWGSLVYLALRGLAFFPAGWRFFAFCWLGIGILFGGLALLLSPAYVGLAYPAGNVIGLVIYLVYQALTGQGQPPAKTRPEQWLLMGLLASLIAHYIEIQIGIAIVATRLFFFIAAALIVLITTGPFLEQAGPKAAAPPKTRKKSGRAELAASGRLAPVLAALLILGLTLGLTTQTFVLVPAGYNVVANSALTTASDFVHLGFFSRNGESSAAIFWLITLTWLIGVTIWGLELDLVEGSPGGRGWLGLLGLSLALPISLAWGLWAGLLVAGLAAFSLYPAWQRSFLPAGLLAIGSFVIGLLFAFIQAFELYAASFAPNQDILNSPLLLALAEASRPADFVATFFGLFLFMILALALALAWSKGGKWATWPGWGAALLMTGLTIFAIVRFNLQPVQADIIYKQGKNADDQAYANRDPAGLDQAIAIYQRVLELAPREDLYIMSLGLAYMQKASITADPAGQTQLWETGQETLERTQNLSPLDSTYALTLARLNVTRARLSAADQALALARATTYYETATRLNPQNAATWNEYANFLLKEMQNCDLARDAYQHSNEIDPFFINTYFDLARLSLDCGDSQNPATYQQAIDILWTVWNRLPDTSTPRAWERLAQQYPNLEEFNTALAAYNDERAQSAAQLKQFLTQADQFMATGDLTQTLRLIQQALDLANKLIDL